MKSLTEPKKHEWTEKEKALVRNLFGVEAGASSYAIANTFTTSEEFEKCITDNIPMYYVATIDDEEFAEDLGFEHYLIPYSASVGSEYYFTGILDWFTVNAVFDTAAKEWTLYYTDLATYDDIPTKVSELENDAGYGKKYVVVNGFSTVEEFEKCINNGVVMYYKTRGYPNTHVDYPGNVTKDVYLIYNYSADMDPSGKVYYFSGIYNGKALYVGVMVSESFFTNLEYEVPIPTKTSELKNDSGYITDTGVFMATYGTTTYAEILEAYRANKGIILNVPGTRVGNGLMDLSMTLARVDNNNDNSLDRYSFTFTTDENGVSYWASINYATKTWNYWNYTYAAKLDSHDASIVSLINQVADLRKGTTVYKREEISANGKFQLREKGFYIFGGSDYDLNLCRANGDTVGKTNSLVVIVFCTEADKNGNFQVYVMQNYKNILTPSMDGMPYDSFTSDCYVHNTNNSAGAYVYYMRQNEVT